MAPVFYLVFGYFYRRKRVEEYTEMLFIIIIAITSMSFASTFNPVRSQVLWHVGSKESAYVFFWYMVAFGVSRNLPVHMYCEYLNKNHCFVVWKSRYVSTRTLVKIGMYYIEMHSTSQFIIDASLSRLVFIYIRTLVAIRVYWMLKCILLKRRLIFPVRSNVFFFR